MKRVITIASFVMPALTALPFALHWAALPDPMASHWGLSGTPDSALPKIVMLLLHVGATLIAALVAIRAVRVQSEQTSHVLGIASFVSFLFTALGFLAVHANIDAPTWRDARPLSLITALCATGLGLGLAALVSRATRAKNFPPDSTTAPSAGLAPRERAVYQKRTKARGLSLLAAAMLIAALFALLLGREDIAFVSSAVAALLIPWTQVCIRIDRQRFTIEYGPLAFPKQSFELDRVERADVIHVTPLSHGGWGYRGSLVLLGRAAVVVRSGTAIELLLRGGRRFVITSDDAERAAGVVNDLRT